MLTFLLGNKFSMIRKDWHVPKQHKLNPIIYIKQLGWPDSTAYVAFLKLLYIVFICPAFSNYTGE